MPVVQFSIPAAPWEKLEKAVAEGESTNQAAKRLLTKLLMGDDSPDPIAAISPDALGDIKERLDRLEDALDRLASTPPDLSPLEEEVSKMKVHWEWAKREILEHREKFKEMEIKLEDVEFALKKQGPTSPPPGFSPPPDGPPPRLPAAQKRKPKTPSGETP